MKIVIFVCIILTCTIFYKKFRTIDSNENASRGITSDSSVSSNERPIAKTSQLVQDKEPIEVKEEIRPINTERIADTKETSYEEGDKDLILEERFVTTAKDEEFRDEMIKKKVSSPLGFYQHSTPITKNNKVLKKIDGVYEGALLSLGDDDQDKQIKLTINHMKKDFELAFLKEGQPYMTTSSDGGVAYFVKQNEKAPKSLVLETFDKSIFVHITPGDNGIIIGNIYKGNKLIGTTRLYKN